MNRLRSSLIVAILLLAHSSWSGAQVLQPPPRPVRGLFGGGRAPDPNRARHELTLTVNLLGGYDDNLTPPGGGSALGPHPSGYIGFGDSIGRYFFGKEQQSLEVVGRGYMNTYRNVGMTPMYGGDLSVRAETRLGRRSQLQLSSSASYDPFFRLGIFGPLHDTEDIANPDQNPTNALTESRSWSTNVSINGDRQWSRRTRTMLGYTFRNQTYLEGGGFDSRTHAASFGFDRELGRTTNVRASYRYSDGDYEQSNGRVRPIQNHGLDAGATYERHLSRSRQFAISGGGGALYVDTVSTVTGTPTQYWTPSAYGNARIDVGQSWSVAADYRRSVSVLEGVHPEPFVGHAATLSVGGFIGERFEPVLSAGYANGRTGQAPEAGATGQYDGYTGTAQLRIRLSRWWSALVNFNHYEYDLNAAARASLGVPRNMQRNSVRVGFTWSVPLYGSYVDRAVASNSERD